MLKVSGILVCAAASAHEAFELLNRGLAPDVALLDYRMPDYNGDVVFERIQQHQPGTPAIFCTAEYDPKLVQRLSALGAAACFGKPFDRVLLIEELNRLLAMRGPLHETRCALCKQRCSDNKVC
jgi:CheY-like chemotaxis protein